MNTNGDNLVKKSGIYIVVLLNESSMPVTRAARYVDTCARVTRANIKIGKAQDFAIRKSDYCKDFDERNILFEPLVETDDIANAEKVILRALKQYRVRSPKGGRLEWLEGIPYEDVKSLVFAALDKQGIKYILSTPERSG